MRSLKADDKNDLVLNSLGNLASVSGLEAIAQNTVTAMKAQLGEMIYALDSGVPTLQTVWDRFDPAQFEAAARDTIRAVEGVRGIESFNVTHADDVLTYVATISTSLGTTTVSGTVGNFING